MNEAKLTTLEQVRAFLTGISAVEFTAYGEDDDRYRHIFEVLTRFSYLRLSKPDDRISEVTGQQISQVHRQHRQAYEQDIRSAPGESIANKGLDGTSGASIANQSGDRETGLRQAIAAIKKLG